MSKKNRLLVCLLLCLIMLCNAFTVSAAEADPMSGTMSLDGDKITVVVDLAKDSQATNGEVQISYDSAKMTLVSTDGSDLWDVEDINEAYSTDTVSLMFASAAPVNEGGTVLTLVFETAADCEVYEASVQVKLYSDMTSIASSEDAAQEEVTFTVSAEKEAETTAPSEEETESAEETTAPFEEETGSSEEADPPSEDNASPSEDSSESAGNTGSSSEENGADTGDQFNGALWLGLLVCSAAVMLLPVIKRKMS